jgi:hypothetical protein
MPFADLHLIEGMFRELDGYQQQIWAVAGLPKFKSARERRRIADMRTFEPRRYRELLDRMNAHYHAMKSDPAWIARRRAKAAAAMRAWRATHPPSEARLAQRRAQQRAYLQRVRQDPKRLEARRKTNRESARRARARQKQQTAQPTRTAA